MRTRKRRKKRRRKTRKRRTRKKRRKRIIIEYMDPAIAETPVNLDSSHPALL